MKEVVKTEYVKTNTKLFVAEDGVEFSDWQQCLDHEHSLCLDKLVAIEQCPQLEYCANFNGEENMECHEYRWYRPKNEEEIDLLNKYIGDDVRIAYDSKGKWICLEEYDGSVWASTLEDGINYVKRLLNELGFEFVITDKKVEKGMESVIL